MKITIEIEMDNDAFVRNRRGEVARILRKLTDKVMTDGVKAGYEWGLYDYDGESVGVAKVEEGK